MEPVATVIIPTFDHGSLLKYSLASALAQSEARLEVIVIGDGAPASTGLIVDALAQSDARVRFVSYPKDRSRGERYRHEALATARGRVVCYLADDDLWLPWHVETMAQRLETADVALSIPLRADAAGDRLVTGPAGFVDLERRLDARLFAMPTSGFACGLSVVAHTLAFYRRLPDGWQTTPSGVATDGWMWRQMIRAAPVRAISTRQASVIQFHSPPRRHWPADRREAEMARWSARLQSVGVLDAEVRRLEATAVGRARARWPLKAAWAGLHAVPGVRRLAMRSAMAIFNRPVA